MDDATKREMQSLIRDLPARLTKLESEGVGMPDSAATHFREEMEQLSSRARDLILTQPPKQLLGYIWSKYFLTVVCETEVQGEEYRPSKEKINEMQFLLEFIHAVWSSNDEFTEVTGSLDEAASAELLETLRLLKDSTLWYCLTKSRSIADAAGDRHRGETHMRAMMSWVHLRGRRYEVLEEEFLQFVLEPHDGALRESYGIGANEIAVGIQAIAHAMRSGLNDAVERIDRHLTGTRPFNGTDGQKSTGSTSEALYAFDDLLGGGICNLSRHSTLTQPVLEDLSFVPGENKEFLADGELMGTPLRTMPARVKPGIKLGDEYYVADSQSIRDVAYRAIQRGLLKRNPQYREDWNLRQKHLIEEAIPRVFANQLAGAHIYRSVFFKESNTQNWVETDLVVVVEDVLLLVEAKAGVMAMQSPAVDFDRHMRSVEHLIVNAYRQCKRFVDYVASADCVPIYELRHGKYIEVTRVRLADFRKVFAIGLTVESPSPFSSCAGNLEGIQPLQGRHAFMSMSVDDLMVLNRFLPQTGELLHYLDVRQQAGMVRGAMLLDETEYLGAYISRNRFDSDLKEQRAEAQFVIWNSYAEIVDSYFEGDDAGKGPVPQQPFPAELAVLLDLLDRNRPAKWLEMDSAIRSLSGEARDGLAKSIAKLKEYLGQSVSPSMLLNDEVPIQVRVCRGGMEPTEKVLRRGAEVACLVAKVPRMLLLQLSCNKHTETTSVRCLSCDGPNPSRDDYAALQREASQLRMRASGI